MKSIEGNFDNPKVNELLLFSENFIKLSIGKKRHVKVKLN